MLQKRIGVNRLMSNFLLCLILFYGFVGESVLAKQDESASEQPPVLDDFSPNPLESQEPDPLLPQLPPEGTTLSSEQQKALEPELIKLNAEAAALLGAGNIPQAFELWNRELRIRRYFGVLPEIEALRRVGLIAWNNNQRLYLKFITERLDAILKVTLSKDKTNEGILQALGLAFKDVRSKDSALTVYQVLLEQGRKQKDLRLEEQFLNEIAQIYLSWLDYPQAAQSYEQLLETQQQISADPDYAPIIPPSQPATDGTPTTAPAPPSEVQSLKQLAFIYEQMGESLKAIAAKEQLAGYYTSQQNLLAVPPLKLSIGSDYEKLGQLEQASQTYQEAYTIATSTQQFFDASNALERLAILYRSQNQIDAALEIYQAQLLVNQQAFNYYGLMNTYDQIGEIYLERKAYQAALTAFQSGLQLAQQLKYKEDYFINKIENLSPNPPR